MFGGGKAQISYLKFDMEMLSLKCDKPEAYTGSTFYVKFVLGRLAHKSQDYTFESNVVEMKEAAYEGVSGFILDKNFEWQTKRCYFKVYQAEQGKKHKKLGEKKHDVAQYIIPADDSTELQITNDISLTFKIGFSIADPKLHEPLFRAANAVEAGGSEDASLIINKLSVVTGQESIANFSVATGSVVNQSILNFSIADANVANRITEQLGESSGDELPGIVEEEGEQDTQAAECKREQKGEYLAMQNKALIEICENLNEKLAKHDADEAKINKQFTYLTDLLTTSKNTVDSQFVEIEKLKKMLTASQAEVDKVKRQAQKDIMAAQFKADAVVQNYKMKESRDVIRAKAEIAIQKEMEKAAAKVAGGVTDAKEPEVPESEQ